MTNQTDRRKGMNNDEKRAVDRMNLEQALIDYYRACEKTGYGFIDDMQDLLFDVTGKRVSILSDD